MPSTAVLQYSSGSSHTSSNDVISSIDDLTANLGNFDSATIAPLTGTTYGVSVSSSSGVPTGLTVARQVTNQSLMNYSVTGTITVASGVVNGSTLTVYDNTNGVVGTSTFTNVTYDNTCCYPVSGSITTAFAAGTTVTTPKTMVGTSYLGKSETLTFSSCGKATLQDPYGYTSTVSFAHCY
jgi:hypothetical protein